MSTPFDAAVRLRRHELECVAAEIAAMTDALSRNACEQMKIADQLEAELRLAAELAHLDTATFAAAQRRRLGALECEQREIESHIESLKEGLGAAFRALKPLESAADAHKSRAAGAAAKAEIAELDEIGARRGER